MFVPASDGRWIDENFARLAEVIKDYDPSLELRWIPHDQRTRDDKEPYVIVDSRNNLPVFYASELDTPTDILAKLFEGDNKNGNVLSRLEARESAVKILEAKQRLESYEEANDVARVFMQSPLNVFKHNNKKFDEQRRFIGPAIERTTIL